MLNCFVSSSFRISLAQSDMLQSFHYTKKTREIRNSPKDGRAVLGDYSSVLLHCLLEKPVLPAILDAFKINVEWEADRIKNYLCSMCTFCQG